MTPCSLENRYQRFGTISRRYLQDSRPSFGMLHIGVMPRGVDVSEWRSVTFLRPQDWEASRMWCPAFRRIRTKFRKIMLPTSLRQAVNEFVLHLQINLGNNTINMAAAWRIWQLSKCCHLVVPSKFTQVSHGKWGVAYSLGDAQRFLSGRSQPVEWIYYCTRVWIVERRFFLVFLGWGGVGGFWHRWG